MSRWYISLVLQVLSHKPFRPLEVNITVCNVFYENYHLIGSVVTFGLLSLTHTRTPYTIETHVERTQEMCADLLQLHVCGTWITLTRPLPVKMQHYHDPFLHLETNGLIQRLMYMMSHSMQVPIRQLRAFSHKFKIEAGQPATHIHKKDRLCRLCHREMRVWAWEVFCSMEPSPFQHVCYTNIALHLILLSNWVTGSVPSRSFPCLHVKPRHNIILHD